MKTFFVTIIAAFTALASISSSEANNSGVARVEYCVQAFAEVYDDKGELLYQTWVNMDCGPKSDIPFLEAYAYYLESICPFKEVNYMNYTYLFLRVRIVEKTTYVDREITYTVVEELF